MGFPKGTTLTPWSESEFDRLQELALEYVSNGQQLMEAFEKFSDETSNLRSVSATRFKFQVVIKPRCEYEYAEAQQKGKEALAKRALEGAHTPIRRNIARLVPSHKSDEDGETRMTQRELVRFLRTVTIIDESADRIQHELDNVRSELQQVVRERDELKHKNLLLEKKYEESQAELEQMLGAFNLARKHATGIVDPSRAKMIINGEGQLVKVEHE